MINWHSITNPYFWAVNLVDVHIGSDPDKIATIPLSTNVAVIDTSSSHTLIPSQDFQHIITFLKRDMLCDMNSKGFYQCLCGLDGTDQSTDFDLDDFFPPIKIQIDK
jgi:hypothetical protein